MSIPVNALKDDELLHYAPLDPGAAAELARRFVDGSIDPGADVEGLRDEIRMIESSLDDEHDRGESLLLFMSQAAEAIRRAMNPDTPQGKVHDLLETALNKLEQ